MIRSPLPKFELTQFQQLYQLITGLQCCVKIISTRCEIIDVQYRIDCSSCERVGELVLLGQLQETPNCEKRRRSDTVCDGIQAISLYGIIDREPPANMLIITMRI